MHRNVENNLRWFFPVVSFSLSLLFQWLPGSLIWSLEPSEDLHCKDVTRAVSLVEWTVISAWLTLVGLWNKTPLFWKATKVRMVGNSWDHPQVPFHSHLFVPLGDDFFFPQQFYPPPKKKSGATVCYGDWYGSLYRNFIPPLQDDHHPRIRLPPGGLKIPAWLPAGDSPGGRKLFGTAPGSIAEKGGRWSCGSFEVNFTGGEAPDSWLCL